MTERQASVVAVDEYDFDQPVQDDGLDEDGNIRFERPRYWTKGGWHCPLIGTEECDWDCDA